MDATVAHIHAVDDGVPKRAAALDDCIQSSYSVYDEPGPRPTKARGALFIGFSHDRGLEVFVLLVFFLSSSSSLGSRGGISFALTAQRPQSTDQVGTRPKARRIMSAPMGCRDIHGRMLPCEIAVGQTWSARWPHINSTSVRS